jgi:drug/metabolite transporter (DMT)-like permease
VALAVLASALLHALWNALLKRGHDPLADLALLTLGASALALPWLPFVPPLPAAAWPWLLLSNLIHAGYYAALAASYRHAELSLAYPLMRGGAPLLVALFALLVLGEHPGAATWAGIAAISLGIVSLAWGQRRQPGAGLGARYALANAGLIAAYTLVDAAGARAAGQALSYVVWMFVLEGLPFAALLLWRRGPAFLAHARAQWRRALLGGGCSALAYGTVVWASTRAPVGAVSALRETSVVFALGLGAWLLGERLDARRWLSVAAVLAGALALRS